MTTNASQYIVKDRQGQNACVDNNPSEGGTQGLEIFADAALDVLRGTAKTQDLGTAFIAMDGEDDARKAASAIERRVMIKPGNQIKRVPIKIRRRDELEGPK